ncbi:MAG: permease-like cell division protein FtsX [Eubacterium sp.]
MGSRKKENHFFPIFKSIFRDTAQSIERNNLMSVASILSVVAALIILGIFVIFTVNLQHITTNVESALELKVFMKNGYTDEQVKAVEQALLGNENIKGVTFESKDEALEKFSSSLEDYSGLLKGYDSSNNPMASSFVVQINNPEDMAKVKIFAEGLSDKGVDYVKYGEEYVDALVSFSKFSNIFSIVILGVLSVISIFIIYNTIKLTCFARRREIRVMKYVGATDWYIRMPFILEGTFLGGMGAIVAMLIIRTGYYYIIAYVGNSVYIPMNSDLVAPSVIMGPIFLFCLIYGIIIGAFGSLFSIRKFLDA